MRVFKSREIVARGTEMSKTATFRQQLKRERVAKCKKNY